MRENRERIREVDREQIEFKRVMINETQESKERKI